MKSTQDLARFLQQLSEERNTEVTIMIYPDKSFTLHDYTEGSNTLDMFYQSDSDGAAIDINDLAYECAVNFNQHIANLASIEEILKQNTTIMGTSTDPLADL